MLHPAASPSTQTSRSDPIHCIAHAMVVGIEVIRGRQFAQPGPRDASGGAAAISRGEAAPSAAARQHRIWQSGSIEHQTGRVIAREGRLRPPHRSKQPRPVPLAGDGSHPHWKRSQAPGRVQVHAGQVGEARCTLGSCCWPACCMQPQLSCLSALPRPLPAQLELPDLHATHPPCPGSG
jgi:hypothetical protein